MTNTAIKFTEQDFLDLERERSRRDCAYFIQENVSIEDKDIKGISIPFSLWPEQLRALASIVSDRLIQILKARQLGLTWLVLSYVAWMMIFTEGYSVIALSKSETDAEELVRRLKFILNHLPHHIAPPLWDGNTERVIIHGHREPSTFQSFPASKNAGRSFTASLLLLDEWAFQQWAHSIWTASFPSINRPTGGKVIGLSTIQRGTLFEELWKDVSSGFTKIFLSWTADPRRDAKWYESTKAVLKDSMLAEYPSTISEAFSIPGGAFFGEFRSHIHIKPKIDIPSWHTRVRVMDYGLDMLACYWIHIDSHQYARIYRELYRENLVISEAAYEILKLSGAKVPETASEWYSLSPEKKQDIAKTQSENIALTFAPPDLFNTSAQTGKAGATIWSENGIYLTKTKNDFEQGCLAMSQWLHPITLRDEQTGAEYQTAFLTITEDVAPNLVNSVLSIQKDPLNPNVYSKKPHGLTHAVDSIRYFSHQYPLTPTGHKQTEPRSEYQKYLAEAFPEYTKNTRNPLRPTGIR